MVNTHTTKESTRITKETATVAEKLQKHLEEHGYTQQELAEKIGVSDALLGAIINKKRNVSAEVLAKLALELNTTADQLLGLVAENPQELAQLKQKKEKLEEQAAQLLAQGAKLPAGERTQIMEKVASLDRQIAELDACIKRSEQLFQKPKHADLAVPHVIGNSAVFRPSAHVDADAAVVVKEDSKYGSKLPKGSILYLKSTNAVQQERLYVVRRDGKIAVSESPGEQEEILGEVTHVLLPAYAYKQVLRSG